MGQFFCVFLIFGRDADYFLSSLAGWVRASAVRPHRQKLWIAEGKEGGVPWEKLKSGLGFGENASV